jgi:hypothetical protein
LISVFFNHTRPQPRDARGAVSDSRADFFATPLSVNYVGCARSGARGESDLMTFAGKLSVVTAYLAIAFVGAIVLGMV